MYAYSYLHTLHAHYTIQREFLEGENFRGLLVRTTYCPLSLQTITEKAFADRYKTAKSAESVLPRKFPAIWYTCVS